MSKPIFFLHRIRSSFPPDEADEHPHVVAGAVGLDRPLQGLSTHVLVGIGDVGQVDLCINIVELLDLITNYLKQDEGPIISCTK